ncbi:MAG: acyltransferase [Gammaproteobacteria bacterium]|nr:acyltransferase [Gammaproteobacteria bacterium]
MLRKTRRNLQGLLTFSASTVNTITWFIPIFLLAVVKFVVPVKKVRTAITRLIMLCGEAWVGTNSRIFALSNSTTWDVRGLDGLSHDQWYLVLANHQTWVDIIALQTVLNRQIPFLKFFIKQELVWFPFLGLAWWAMDMPFMKRYSKSYLAAHPEKKGRDLEATRRACVKFRDAPTTVINFVEGTRFTEEKRTALGSPYDHLLKPKAGGVALAMTSMGEMFDAILDVTIVYPDGPIAFWDMVCGEFGHVIIDIEKRPVEEWLCKGDYENDREFRKRFHQWLANCWEEKDEKIGRVKSASA